MFNFKHLKRGFDWYSEVKVKNNSTFAAELSSRMRDIKSIV